MDFFELKAFLDDKVQQYNNPSFLDYDPLQIPHRYGKKEDQEIAGFFAAILAWGNRKSIIKSAEKLMQLMDESPYDFVLNHKVNDRKPFENFVHRTFQGPDVIFFLNALQCIYKDFGGLQLVLKPEDAAPDYHAALHRFKAVFFSFPEALERTKKHLADPEKGSAAKRLHMFLRWMVRSDEAGVDLGIWPDHSSAKLSCPLDVHTARVARVLGLLSRKQNDIKAVKELDNKLRQFNSLDPASYDFALFGLGAFENF